MAEADLTADLFGWKPPLSYPDRPGHRNVDTSIAAAEALAPKLGQLQDKVLCAIREAAEQGRTGDETASRLEMERWAVRPRTSELRRKGLIKDSGQRRPNCSGRLAIVWIATCLAKSTMLGNN